MRNPTQLETSLHLFAIALGITGFLLAGAVSSILVSQGQPLWDAAVIGLRALGSYAVILFGAAVVVGAVIIVLGMLGGVVESVGKRGR